MRNKVSQSKHCNLSSYLLEPAGPRLSIHNLLNGVGVNLPFQATALYENNGQIRPGYLIM
jgi:hypothetical protein